MARKKLTFKEKHKIASSLSTSYIPFTLAGIYILGELISYTYFNDLDSFDQERVFNICMSTYMDVDQSDIVSLLDAAYSFFTFRDIKGVLLSDFEKFYSDLLEEEC